METTIEEIKTSRLNVKMLRRIQRAILAEPKRMNMGKWYFRTFKDSPEFYEITKAQTPACNTVACIAGWAVALETGLRGSTKLECVSSIEFRGANILGLEGYGTDSSRLFYTTRWPPEFAKQLEKYKPGTKKYAEVVAKRIDHFITTGE